MEAESQPIVEDEAEVKDEVKSEDVTGDEAEGAERGGSGYRDVKTLEDTGVNEDQSTLQNDQGESCPNEETEIKVHAEQGESVIGKNEGGEQREASTGEIDAQSEDRVEHGDVRIEEELRSSKRSDEGDEVVSSKVTTVSFASEVLVLNEDEIEEKWTTAGGDNNEEDANQKDENTVGIDESLENKEEVVLKADNVVNTAQSKSEEEVRDEVAVAEGDSNEQENIPAAEPQADEQEQPHVGTAEITAPLEESAAVNEKASEEVDIVTPEQNKAVESEEPLPVSAPMDGLGVVTEASTGKVTNTAEHNLEARKEGGEEDGHGEIDDVPVLQFQEEKLEKEVVEVVKVVHRSMKSSAPEVTLEATLEDSTEQGVTESEETAKGEGNEAHENVPVLQYDEVETENPVLEAEEEVNRSLQAGTSDDNVETTGIDQEHTSQEDYESGNPVQMPEGEMIGAEVNGDDDHQDSHYGIHEVDDAEQGAVDSHIELEANSALQDDNQIFEENQGEHCQRDLIDPSETLPYETDPNLSSVNQEDVPLDGNFSEYEQQPMLPSDVDPLPPIEPEVVRQDVLQLQEDQRMEGLSPIELLTQANEAHGVLPTPLRSPYHQQHPRSRSNLESTNRDTSLSRVQIARILSPPAHVKAQMSVDEERRASTRTSSRLPPSVMKMSSVMVNARKKAVKNRDASVYYEERQFHKTLTLDECINSRPPMPFDLDTPGPCQYSPRNKPLYEDNAPEYSFGMKFPERGGGGRTAYSKTWFNSNSNYTVKTRFERRWPSPNAYGSGRSMVGRKIPDKRDFPSFSMRAKTKFTINKNGSENEPGPDQYQRQRSDPLLFRRAPAFSMGAKLNRGRLFGTPELTPAPNYYNPHTTYTSRKVTYPAFTITGIRKPKSHALGPHATL